MKKLNYAICLIIVLLVCGCSKNKSKDFVSDYKYSMYKDTYTENADDYNKQINTLIEEYLKKNQIEESNFENECSQITDSFCKNIDSALQEVNLEKEDIATIYQSLSEFINWKISFIEDAAKAAKDFYSADKDTLTISQKVEILKKVKSFNEDYIEPFYDELSGKKLSINQLQADYDKYLPNDEYLLKLVGSGEKSIDLIRMFIK